MIIFRILLQFYADFLQTVHRFISLIAKRMLNHSIMTQYVSCAFAKHGRIALYYCIYIYTYTFHVYVVYIMHIKRTIRQTRRSHFDCCTLYDRTDRLHLIYQPYTTHPKCSCVFSCSFFIHITSLFFIISFILLLAAVLVAGTVLGGALADAANAAQKAGTAAAKSRAAQQPAAEK